jgi:ABC-type multidrug transport system permease subunit
MGFLWKAIGVQWAFSFGAAMALIAALLATVLMRKSENSIGTISK